MKAKELIRLLQEEDPTGETEVCVNNVDIWTVQTEPAYWDGRLQLLIRDESKKPYFDVIGGKYCTKGSKIVLTPMSVSDVLWGDPEAIVDYSELGEARAEDYRASDEKTRQACRDVILKVEKDAFYRWVKKKAQEIRPDSDDPRWSSDSFFDKYLHVGDPLKELPPKKHVSGGQEYESWPSVNERRESGWDDTFEVGWYGGWRISKKDGTGSAGE